MPPSFRELGRAGSFARRLQWDSRRIACLINRLSARCPHVLATRTGNELDLAAPIVSVSLGLPAIFLFGGLKRSDKTEPVFGCSTATFAVWGGLARLAFHGVRAAGRRRAMRCWVGNASI